MAKNYKYYMCANTGRVWEGYLLSMGGFGGTPPDFCVKINPSFLPSGALCGSFEEILKG